MDQVIVSDNTGQQHREQPNATQQQSDEPERQDHDALVERISAAIRAREQRAVGQNNIENEEFHATYNHISGSPQHTVVLPSHPMQPPLATNLEEIIATRVTRAVEEIIKTVDNTRINSRHVQHTM